VDKLRRTLKVTLAYEGTDFKGWQDVSSAPSIEGTFKRALEQILQERVTLKAASRTDAGVHARGQVLSFKTEKLTPLENKLRYSLNRLLPSSISVIEIEEVNSDFDATNQADFKLYTYRLSPSKIQEPLDRRFAWHFSGTYDLEAMREGAKMLTGTHDFSAFTNQRKELPENRVCTLHQAIITRSDLLEFHLLGDRFLYKMARNLVGTLVYVGLKKMDKNAIRALLSEKDRTLAGPTAPAHGLTLERVFFSSDPSFVQAEVPPLLNR